MACQIVAIHYRTDLFLVRLYSLTMILPHLAVLLSLGGFARQVLAPMAIAYLAYLFMVSRGLHRTSWESLVNSKLLELSQKHLGGGAVLP